MIIKTVISFEPFLMSNVPNTFSARNNFYELFGFDILIEENMRPWLIEVKQTRTVPLLRASNGDFTTFACGHHVVSPISETCLDLGSGEFVAFPGCVHTFGPQD